MLTITATNLSRFMVCNGSRLMGDHSSPIDGDTTVRDEGNAADWLVRQVHEGNFTAEELIDRKAPNGVYITSEMFEYLEEYLKEIKYDGTEIEADTSHGGQCWQINGRADSINYNPYQSHLYINDLKYGWRIIEPYMNWTLISHAAGWLFNNPTHTQNVEQITFTIYQPRPDHFSGRVRSWTIDIVTLKMLAAEIHQTLSSPTDILNTSPHCDKCPALAGCPAAKKAQMNAIEASEKAFDCEIDNTNLSFQLNHLKRASEALKHLEKAYSDLALDRVRQGEIVENYSAETGQTNRQWKKHITPEIMKILTGKDLIKKQLITPKQAENAGVSKEVVSSLTERHNKGVKLVRVDANTKASKLFNVKKGN